MSEEEKTLQTWEEVIVDFLKGKRDAEEEKYLKEELKRVGELYKKENYFNDESIEILFDPKKNRKRKDQTALEFQRQRVSKVVALENKPSDLNGYKKKKEYIKKVRSIEKKYTPAIWLSENCSNAENVTFATHVIKLTHSKIDTPSLFDCIDAQSNRYLTTSTLHTKAIDGAVKGNQFAPIFQFLELELDGVKLAEYLSRDDRIFVGLLPEGMRDDEAENRLKKWTEGFRKSLNKGEMKTHSLAKQIYFPITGIPQRDEKEEYHLLCNVISSSLAHAIHEKVFDDQQKSVKKANEKSRFSSDTLSKFIRRSVLSVTASNHSNASQLNGKRGGRLHLFSSRPPTWQSRIKPPVNRKSLFDDFHNGNSRTDIEYLRDFLLRFGKLDLSIRDPRRMQYLERWVHSIIDELLFYAGTIQNLPAGWSADQGIRLKKEHQYFLDPYRTDENFQAARGNSDWQAMIRSDFARWLNNRLRGKDNKFTPRKEHARLWVKLMEPPLREFMEPVEIEVKQRMKESA